nr:unnamed protein product [Callosobruchus analis]
MDNLIFLVERRPVIWDKTTESCSHGRSVKAYVTVIKDGSKSDDKVGSAFITSEQSHYWKLDRASSIFTAELYAIWQALRWRTSGRKNKPDCKS